MSEQHPDGVHRDDVAHRIQRPAPKVSAEAAAEILATLEAAQHRVATATLAVRSARRVLSDAVTDYQRDHPKLTPLENQRQFQEASVRERAAAINAPAPAPTPCADSAVDLQAKYSKGPVGASYGAFRRGAHPQKLFGQRVKLPSER